MEKDIAGISFRPADPGLDFERLAAWFTFLEDDYNSPTGLRSYYKAHRDNILARVAEHDNRELWGFCWAARSRVDPGWIDVSLYVSPEHRCRGLGDGLCNRLLQDLVPWHPSRIRVNVHDTSPESRKFAERRGFVERKHQIVMSLDLRSFDDQPFDRIISSLQDNGFMFTSMEALGDTQEARRKLFILNDAAAITTPGTNGEHSWASFEDFQKSVCQSEWYKPAGQIVAVDKSNGAWAAMSAITRREGNDFAYNLFTGVDMPYRGRKLAQAVKVLALRYARDTLGASSVRTHHNDGNAPMIAIDRKLGYLQAPGYFVMEKPVS